MIRAAFIPVLLTAWTAFVPFALGQTASQPWSEPDGVPIKVGAGGGMIVADGSTLLVACGEGTRYFFKLDLPSWQWSRRADTPVDVGDGASVTSMPGSGFAWLLPGNGSRKFYRYDIALNQWAPQADLPQDTSFGSCIAATSTAVYALAGGGSAAYRFIPDGGPGTWEGRHATPQGVSVGGFLMYPGSGDTIFAVRSYDVTGLWSYSVSANEWDATHPTLRNTLGRGLAADPSNPGMVYAFENSWSTGNRLLRYDSVLRAWLTLPAPPGPLGPGAALTFPSGGRTLHVLRGGDSGGWTANTMWRFDADANRFQFNRGQAPALISSVTSTGNGDDFYALSNETPRPKVYLYRASTDVWSPMATAPMSAGEATTIAYANGILYVLGLNLVTFSNINHSICSYTFATGQWSELTEIRTDTELGMIRPGAQALHDGNNSLYLISGSGYSSLFRCDLPGGSWTSLPHAPAPFAAGGGMTYHPATQTLFALRGGDTTADGQAMEPHPNFWSFSTVSNQWNAVDPTDCPEGVSLGGAICYPGSGGTIYAFTGRSDAPASACSLWAYSIQNDEWTPQTAAPGTSGPGTLLVAVGGNSPYLFALAGNETKEFWRYAKEPASPRPPAGLSQFHLDGLMPIPAGGLTMETGLIVRAVVTDDSAAPGPVRLQVEFHEIDAPFTDMATATSAEVASGATAAITLSNLTLNQRYRWQAWTVNAGGKKSRKVSFGTNPDDAHETDVFPRSNRVPGAPALEQRDILTGALTPVGGESGNRGIQILGLYSDQDDDAGWIEIEVRPVGTPFRGQPTQAGSTVPSGDTSRLTFDLPNNFYHWQARAMDVLGGASAWTSFGGNGEEAPDFRIHFLGGSLGTSSCFLSLQEGGKDARGLLFLLAAGFLVRRRFSRRSLR